MEKFFRLKENGTNVSTEVLAGLTTFFTMAYILFVNPSILSDAGLPAGGVYIATILAAVVGTTVMGLFANVPYAQAPGMGLNAFFAYTVVLKFGYTPYEALALVFICGLINIFITVTRIRKHIIKAIPETLQNAIGAGIGLFIAYIGLLNVGLINFDAGVPALVSFSSPNVLLFLCGLLITVLLMVKRVKGAMLIGIILTTIIGIPMGVVDLSAATQGVSYSSVFGEFKDIFGVALGSEGLGSLFTNHSFWSIFPIIFAFSLTDTFDTIGTFIGTGRRTGIFSEEDEKSLEEGKGFSSKMDKAMFADAIATSVGAIFGTSNTTTYVESAAGIEEGGRTGLTSMTVSVLFLLSIMAAPIIGVVPSEATAPALVVVGVLMSAACADIQWTDIRHAIPAFFTLMMTVLSYSISNGLAFGFIAYVVVEVALGNYKKVHPIVYISTILFIINFILS
ncbi:guanine permease [Erysipelothrix larvae]|uniref:Guanine permease n=1 Tax=Erysipelothrix larvae TaxID=1514105 RepID=A0A0X8H1D8_9FIRM|nr:NCS2 family permease [Erysipelothrix larvae]AMC94329.1 guanine permease [Erysipelothrix larvae]